MLVTSNEKRFENEEKIIFEIIQIGKETDIISRLFTSLLS